jgi:hypothetical protein
MNAAQKTNSDNTSALANAYPLRWEGHMCDGVGTTGGSVPGAVLCANADEIWLKGLRGDFHFLRHAVVRIGRAGMYPWFFRGIRIRHNVAGYPSDLRFGPWSARSGDILAQLKSLGFPTG